MSASIDTLLRRMAYGGRKGRSAARRLRRGIVYVNRTTGMRLRFAMRVPECVRVEHAKFLIAGNTTTWSLVKP